MAELSEYQKKSDYQWYAVYTRMNHEKAVEAALRDRHIEVFLPKRKILKRWADRKKWIEEPLFRPYLFVNVSQREYARVLQTPSVIKYICFGGKAAPVNEKEIEFLKTLENSQVDYEVSAISFRPLQKVIVTHGLFSGQSGEVMRENGRTRLVVKVGQVNCAVMLDIDHRYLEVMN